MPSAWPESPYSERAPAGTAQAEKAPAMLAFGGKTPCLEERGKHNADGFYFILIGMAPIRGTT